MATTRQRKRSGTNQRGKASMSESIKIISSIVIGGVILIIIVFMSRALMAKVVLESLQKHTQKQAEVAKQQQVALIQAQRDKEIAVLREQERIADRRREDAVIAQQIANQAAEEKSQKEAAFKRFYQKPAECNPPTKNMYVECGNKYIRARAEFERLYLKN